MNSAKVVTLICVGLAGMMPQVANAQVWNRKTIFTFSGPVEIPGQVLNAGTYVFRLADSSSNRNIVQVFNKDQDHLYGTFLAIPNFRLKPTGEPIITFHERPAGSPPAVKAWFYPGHRYGHEFVYPRTTAVELAKANDEPVPAMPDELGANTKMPTRTVTETHIIVMRRAPLKAEEPDGKEVGIGEAFEEPPAAEK